MEYRIVVTSSANMHSKGNVVSVPLRINTANNEYVDDENLNLDELIQDLKTCNSKTGTSCPNVNDWVSAFGDCENIFAISISSKLSGAFNAARLAKEDYLESHPQANVHVIDSLNAGPGERIIVEKIEELVDEGLGFEEIVKAIDEYNRKKRIVFSLKSFDNLANNGRVSKVLAAAAGFLGIHVIASDDEGIIHDITKVKGEKRAIKTILSSIVIIDTVRNQKAAESMQEAIKAEYPEANIEIGTTGGLCTYYAEDGGLLVSFETK